MKPRDILGWGWCRGVNLATHGGEGLQPLWRLLWYHVGHTGGPMLACWGQRGRPPRPTVTHSWGGRGVPSIQCQPWGPRRAPTQEYLVTGYLLRKS